MLLLGIPYCISKLKHMFIDLMSYSIQLNIAGRLETGVLQCAFGLTLCMCFKTFVVACLVFPQPSFYFLLFVLSSHLDKFLFVCLFVCSKMVKLFSSIALNTMSLTPTLEGSIGPSYSKCAVGLDICRGSYAKNTA